MNRENSWPPALLAAVTLSAFVLVAVGGCGSDFTGGTELVYELQTGPDRDPAAVQEQAAAVMRHRLDRYRHRVVLRGADRVVVQLPPLPRETLITVKRRLERMGKLAFRLGVPHASDREEFQKLYRRAEEGKVPEGYLGMHVEDDPDRPFYLVERGEPAITGRHLADVRPTIDDIGRPAIGVEFDARGSRALAEITGNNVGRVLAIILDGVLKSAPRIQTRIAGRGIIQGHFTRQEVAEMVAILESGSLPAPVELIEERTVGVITPSTEL